MIFRKLSKIERAVVKADQVIAAKTLRAARAAVCPELNRPIIESVADRIIEELKNA